MRLHYHNSLAVWCECCLERLINESLFLVSNANIHLDIVIFGVWVLHIFSSYDPHPKQEDFSVHLKTTGA